MEMEYPMRLSTVMTMTRKVKDRFDLQTNNTKIPKWNIQFNATVDCDDKKKKATDRFDLQTNNTKIPKWNIHPMRLSTVDDKKKKPQI